MEKPIYGDEMLKVFHQIVDGPMPGTDKWDCERKGVKAREIPAEVSKARANGTVVLLINGPDRSFWLFIESGHEVPYVKMKPAWITWLAKLLRIEAKS